MLRKKICLISLGLGSLLVSLHAFSVSVVSPGDIPKIDPARVQERVRLPMTERPAQIVAQVKETGKKIKEEGPVKFYLKKVDIEGVTVFKSSELLPIYKKYLHKTVNIGSLHKIAQAITLKYRNAGYMLSRALVPAQQIHNGHVRIQVVEGYVNKVHVQGKVSKWVRAKLQTYAGKIEQSRPLNVKTLERNVLLSNDLPGLEVKAVISPSKTKFAAADLTFIVHEKKLQIATDFNNHGTRYLGPLQWSLTPQINNVFWGADRLGARLVETATNDDMLFMQTFYQRALGASGLKWDMTLDYTRTKPGFSLEALHLYGESKTGMSKLSYPIFRSRRTNWYVNTSFKWLDTKTDYSAAVLYEDHIRSLRFGTTVNYVDRFRGISTADFQFSRGLRAFGSSSRSPGSNPLSRTNARSDYKKVNFDFSRLQALKYGVSTLFAATGQYSWDPLLSAEEFGFGGMQYGRGYDPSEIIGDRGGAAKVQLNLDKYPAWRFLKHVQYYVFYDAGFVVNTGDDHDQPGRETAMSLGTGIQFNFTRHIAGSFLLARPMTHQVQTQADSNHYPQGWRGFFSISAFF